MVVQHDCACTQSFLRRGDTEAVATQGVSRVAPYPTLLRADRTLSFAPDSCLARLYWIVQYALYGIGHRNETGADEVLWEPPKVPGQKQLLRRFAPPTVHLTYNALTMAQH